MKTPVTLLTGFLGAGKTTLLNNILTGTKEKIAVIVNEFGDISIDDRLLLRSDEEIMELATGSICCAVKNDVVKVLTRLADNKDAGFDRVVIETTGLANPGPIINAFVQKQALRNAYQVEQTVTVIDASHILDQIVQTPEAKSQIALADTLILNKVALVDDLEPVEDMIRRINPLATIVKTNHSVVDMNIILSPVEFKELPEHIHEDHSAHRHDDELTSFVLTADRPLDLEKVTHWIATDIILNGERLLRYKGILDIAGMDERFVFQGLHMQFSNKKDRRWTDSEPRNSEVVIIGKNIDYETFQENFSKTVAD